MIGQVTDVKEQAMLALCAIMAEWAMIRLAANIKILYNKFELQGYVVTTRSLKSWLQLIICR